MRHVVKSQQFDREALTKLFGITDRMRKAFEDPKEKQRLSYACIGKMMMLLFYEPSTRTRLSFQSAAVHLGMTTASTENAGEFSSAVKGESLHDTIHVLCSYKPDVIVLRHKKTGAGEVAANIAEQYGVSIMNAGDGAGQHPTQALLDVYTINNELKSIDNKVVLLGGDLANGRTVRSLAYLLSKFDGVRLIFFSLPELQIGSDILQHLDEHHIEYKVITDCRKLPQVLAEADVVYWTRFQKERIESHEVLAQSYNENCTIGPNELKHMKNNAIIMHPLPRVSEISEEIDRDRRAAYFRQAENGLYVRMALLYDQFSSL